MTTKNIALTVDQITIVAPARYSKGAKQGARLARELGKVVTLKNTTEEVTDLTAGLRHDSSCDDCERCGAFVSARWLVDTGFESCGEKVLGWYCHSCVAGQTFKRLAIG